MSKWQPLENSVSDIAKTEPLIFRFRMGFNTFRRVYDSHLLSLIWLIVSLAWSQSRTGFADEHPTTWISNNLNPLKPAQFAEKILPPLFLQMNTLYSTWLVDALWRANEIIAIFILSEEQRFATMSDWVGLFEHWPAIKKILTSTIFGRWFPFFFLNKVF